MKYTGNYNLKKPEGTDVVNIDDLNYNADILDQKLKEIENKANNAPPNSVNDLAIGIRTPDQTQVPTSPGSGTLSQILSWLANRIKTITGKTNWWDTPPTTLQAAKNHIDAAAPHSGHETPAGAQAKAEAAAGAVQAELNTHLAKKAHQGEVHGFRVTDSKLKFFDGSDWVEIKTGDKLDADTVDGYHAGTGANNVLVLDANGKVPSANLPIASTSALGAIKVGANLSIDASGVLSVTGPSHGKALYTTPGTYTFTVPDGVTEVYVTMCGGGGGGGGGLARGEPYAGGGGGGAHAVIAQKVTVTPGQQIPVTVGAGGNGGRGSSGSDPDPLNGTAGGASSFGTFISCPGGGGGSRGYTGHGNGGAAGGAGGAKGAKSISTSSDPLNTTCYPIGGSSIFGDCNPDFGANGAGFGAGGAGGRSGGYGGKGADGFVLIEW